MSARWKPDTPLLGNLGNARGITAPRVLDGLHRFFQTGAQSIQAVHPALAARLKRATRYWMGHTHAAQALAQGAMLTTVRAHFRLTPRSPPLGYICLMTRYSNAAA